MTIHKLLECWHPTQHTTAQDGSDWRPSGPGAGWHELGHTNNDDGRLGYGGSHGGVGGYMYIWRTHNGQMRYRGGDPPIGETGGGKMGYGSYKTPRTQGSSGTPGHYYRRYGAAGGAAIEIEARNLRVDGAIDTKWQIWLSRFSSYLRTGAGAGAQAEVSCFVSVENSREAGSSQPMEVRVQRRHERGGGGGGRISVLCSGTGTVDTTNVPRMHAFGGRGFDDDFAENSFGAQKRLYHGGGSGGSAGTVYRDCPNSGTDWTNYLLLDNNHRIASHPTFVVEKDLVEFEFATVQLIRGRGVCCESRGYLQRLPCPPHKSSVCSETRQGDSM